MERKRIIKYTLLLSFLIINLISNLARAEKSSYIRHLTIETSSIKKVLNQDNYPKIIELNTDGVRATSFICHEDNPYSSDIKVYINNIPHKLEKFLPKKNHLTLKCISLENSNNYVLIQKDTLLDNDYINLQISFDHEYFSTTENLNKYNDKNITIFSAGFKNMDPFEYFNDLASEMDFEISKSLPEFDIPNINRFEGINQDQQNSPFPNIPPLPLAPPKREVRLAIETTDRYFDGFREHSENDFEAFVKTLIFIKNYVYAASIVTSRDLDLVLKPASIFLYSQDQWRCTTLKRTRNDVQAFWNGEGKVYNNLTKNGEPVEEFELCSMNDMEIQEGEPGNCGGFQCIRINDLRVIDGVRAGQRAIEQFGDKHIANVMVFVPGGGGNAPGPGSNHFRSNLGNENNTFMAIGITPNYEDFTELGHELAANRRGAGRNENLTNSWGLKTLVHEFGHVAGSPHSHCLILPNGQKMNTCASEGREDRNDDCFNAEVINSPDKGIMSYCSGKKLFFEDYVKQGIKRSIRELLDNEDRIEELNLELPLIENDFPIITNIETSDLNGLHAGDVIDVLIEVENPNDPTLAYIVHQSEDNAFASQDNEFSITLDHTKLFLRNDQTFYELKIQVANRFGIDERIINIPVENRAPDGRFLIGYYILNQEPTLRYTYSINDIVDHENHDVMTRIEFYQDENLVNSINRPVTRNNRGLLSSRIFGDYTFPNPGQYTIRVTLTDEAGLENIIFDRQVSIFGPDPELQLANPPQTVGFNRNFTLPLRIRDPFNQNIRLTINWGDGNRDITEWMTADEYRGIVELEHVYQRENIGRNRYVISLETERGSRSSIQNNIIVENNAPRVSNLSFRTPEINYESSYLLSALAIDRNNDITSYQWIIGDDIINSQEPNIIYRFDNKEIDSNIPIEERTFTVIVTDSFGLTHVRTIPITEEFRR